jgi:Flp pilus assembly protein TadD
MTRLRAAAEEALAMGLKPLAWRARSYEAQALDRLGRAQEAENARGSAHAIVQTMADAVSDPEQRELLVHAADLQIGDVKSAWIGL